MGARVGGGSTKPSMDETTAFKQEKKITEITAELPKRCPAAMVTVLSGTLRSGN